VAVCVTVCVTSLAVLSLAFPRGVFLIFRPVANRHRYGITGTIERINGDIREFLEGLDEAQPPAL